MRLISRYSSLAGMILLLSAADGPVSAQVDVDRTCAGCGRLKNDSLNLKIRKIRLNQVGYMPDDPNKAAFVADPAIFTFKVLDASTRKEVFSGPLKDVGTNVEGAMIIKNYYSSIMPLDSMSRPAASVHLYRADFSGLKIEGTYLLTSGSDTSSHFQIQPKIYNFVFETALKFFGSQRCGKADSWMHGDCHLKDGDFLGAKYSGALSGGWHDCGDHIKVGETLGYSAAVLAMTYAFWPEKAEDFYGKSYLDTLPFGTDGVPDVLYEAKVGADYILKLYQVSKETGLIAKGDMYHGIIDLEDHDYWDVPEHQDAQPHRKGGPPRTVRDTIGSNVAGMYAAALAFFAWGWEPYDAAYAKTCLQAATDIYDKIVMARRGSVTKGQLGLYPGGGPTADDEALAAFALWYATKDPRFRRDLLEDPARGTSPTAVDNQGYFPTGILAYDNNRPFHPGGWVNDYENTFVYVLYGLSKLITGNHATAQAYGLSPTVADSLNADILYAIRRLISENSNGTNITPWIKAAQPYHDMFSGMAWGFNRYNMGSVLGLFFYWDLTRDPAYYNIGMDNLNYLLGMNPWDISFVVGAGEKNTQHPHNRASNPEGYNAGGFPYKYTPPLGALMGGAKPNGGVLVDVWDQYTNSETCIDFSAQLLTSTQMLAQDLPPDKEGPKFRNVNIFPEERSALVTWSTDEISRDTLILLDAPGGRVLQTLPAEGLLRDKQINIAGLTPSTTYYIYFRGRDVRGNTTEDRNNGEYWKFTTKATTVAAQYSNVKVCNETHESALVTWWTRNGYYSSQVDYGTTTGLGQSKSPDDAGIPSMFHRVTLEDLSPATLYYFQVLSGGPPPDNNGGKFYQFKTTEVLVDYTVRIKPTNKGASGQSAHFYIDVANNEAQPYYGLELRFYFTSDATTAADLVARGFDNQIFDVGGIARSLNVTYGAARQVPGMPDQWYFPITLNDTLPVAGRARFELQINSGGPNGWNNQPFAYFNQAWSIRSHSQPPDPVPFGGVDLTRGSSGAYKGPDMIEVVNGKNIVSYTENPYITAYYKGVHVFGYGPDYLTDVLQVRRQVTLALTQPVASPVDRLDLRQETGSITLAGKASSDPDGRIDEIVVNGDVLPAAELSRDASGTVAFSHPVTLQEGTNVFDIIAWDTAHCAVETRKLIVNWRKGPPKPPPQAAKPVADPPGSAGRDSIVVGLTTATPGAAIWYTLDGSPPSADGPGSTLYTGPIVIRNQTTLKAIAAKADHTPSDVLTETYDVFPFKVANIRSATLVDGDADGYADAIRLALDTALGAPVEAVVAGQLSRAALTSGLAAGAPRLAGDTIMIPLAANTLWVRNLAETLTVPPPAALQDGMLRPGTFPLRDGVAPVLRRALLVQGAGAAGTPGRLDTLVIAVSEPLQLNAAGPRPFAALRLPDSLGYVFALASGAPAALPGLKPGETAYRFVITATPSAADPAASVAPQPGDWVNILPTGNVTDTVANAQLNPANVRVPLQVRVALVQTVHGVSPDGISRIPAGDPAKPWVVYGGPNLTGTIGDPGASLPVIPVRPEGGRSAGLVIESTLPFSVTVRVHTTLGQYVGKVRLKVSERDFALLQAGSSPGARRLELLWNGRAENGNPAGTGAYVFLWNLSFFPPDQPPSSAAGKSVFGILRQPLP